MDIIDIILASKKSFSGETETLVRQAREAMAQANEVATILQDAQDANTAAQAANEAAQEAQTRAEEVANNFEALKSDFTSAAETLTNEIIDDKIYGALGTVYESIDSLENTVENNYTELSTSIQNVQEAASNAVNVTVQDANTTNAKIKRATITKNGNSTSYDVEKNYTGTGNNEDGSMTQKAIKDYVTSVKSELETKIQNSSGSSSGAGSFSVDDAGNIVVVGPDGAPIAGSTSEQDIITALINAGVYNVSGTVGLQIDYANKSFTRIQDAESKTAGADFNSYPMFGGRMRCNVADDGTINAFYGDANYKDDGSNGQVMVYQPKFYYQRTPITMTKLIIGNIVRKETLILSNEKKSGFKLHPLFINEDGAEVDYILLPAYQGSIYDYSASDYNTNSTLTIDFANDKLSSVADAKPIGSNSTSNFTIENAEQLARNRGAGWHITNMAVESANQMLEIVEFGQLNLQNGIESGIVSVPTTSNTNCASLTGSTASLGNNTGAAQTTISEANGARTSYSVPGKRAISYRGVENPWGNIWHFIGGLNIYGTSRDDGGYPYVCKNFNYNYTTVDDNYENIGFKLPSTHSWISAMGYGNSDYDWVLMPAECSSANSALPVGDSFWSYPNLNGTNCAIIGGTWESEDSAGPFYYGCDRELTYSKFSFGANLMFIPQKNSIYNANINKWRSKFEG